MQIDGVDRRSFLKTMGTAGLSTAFPAAAFAAAPSTGVVEEMAAPAQGTNAKPAYSVRFAVAGMSHDHIYGMVDAMIRGGGVLVSVYAAEPERGAAFLKRYPQAKAAQSEDEILNDSSIQLVLSSAVPNTRAPLGIRAMRHGKDFLSDKPAVTTLDQLAEVRKTIAETKRIFAIMYSERLEVKAAVRAGELVQAGAIGKVIQTINIAPHQIIQKGGDAGGGSGRPDWFWEPEKYGGILCDIGSHQVDQFLFYTGSTHAEIVSSQVANVRHKDHPKFQDFGDMTLRGNSGFGYVRLDWFTPNGLGTWGDGRLFILGTDGYMELRKYTDVAAPAERKGGNHIYLVDAKEARYIDCNNLTLPFGPQFISDVVNRTHTAQDQTQCLLAAELVIRAQQGATHATIEG
ncbi:MAG TPA: Gfo/Idh/MocA family oxidoreductase [Acidobacteriaceae bacterium]|jgi:predicted dehydrogenase